MRGGLNSFDYAHGNALLLLDPKGLLTAVQAYEHYCSGNGTPLTMNFADLGVTAMNATSFAAVKSAISGPCKTEVIPISDSRAYTTQGDVWLIVGDVTLKLNGLLYKACDCSWNFVGVLSAADDFYNFNASTHRSFSGESLTTLGRLIGKACGAKPYTIKFSGSMPMTGRGTMGGPPTCCGVP